MDQLTYDLMQYVIKNLLSSNEDNWLKIETIYCGVYEIQKNSCQHQIIRDICVEALEAQNKAYDKICQSLHIFNEKEIVMQGEQRH